MPKYSPADILRKYVLRQCIAHLVVTSEHAVWFNLTFWENVTNKAYASKCWDRLCKQIRSKNPGFRLVGVWARQARGAWHIHAVCNQRFDLDWLRSKAMRAGFGPQFYVKEIDSDPRSPEKIARYISGYCTDKNGLDPVRDKGVRRTIFVGPNVKVVDMRYRSGLKRVTTRGRFLSAEIESDVWRDSSDFERQFSALGMRRKAFETWGDWYRRNREFWFAVGWASLSVDEQRELMQLDEFVVRYFTTGQWAYL